VPTLGSVIDFIGNSQLRIPVNVTGDSGNVTGIAAKVTDGRCCAF
jgi:hypothetical protein